MYSNYLEKAGSPSTLSKLSFSPKVPCGGVSILHRAIFQLGVNNKVDHKSLDKGISIDENRVRSALIRAYMKGERSTEIDMKQFIQELANDIKGSPTT